MAHGPAIPEMHIRTKRLLGLIFIAALALRLFGIWYGLPAEYRPDEDMVINRGLNILDGQFDVHYFMWPSLYFWMAAPILFVTMIVGNIFGITGWPVGNAIIAATTNPTPYYLAMRSFDSLCGAALIFPVFFLARRLTHRESTAIIAALIAATAFISVRESHFGLQDAPAALCVAFALLLAVRAYQQHPAMRTNTFWVRAQPWLIAAGLAGAATALKFHPGIVLAPVLILAVVRNWKIAICGGVVAVITYLVLSPELLFHPKSVIGGVLHASLDKVGGTFNFEPSLSYYFFTVLPAGYGIPVLVLGVIGAARMFRNRNLAGIVLFVDVVLVVLFMGHAASSFFRYMLPVLPGLAVLAAFGIQTLADLGRKLWRYQVAATVALALVACIPMLISDFYFDGLMATTDTRTVLYDWALANIPSTNSVAVGQFSGFFHDQAFVDSKYNYTGDGAAKGVIDSRLGPWHQIYLYDLDNIAQAQKLTNTEADYIVITSLYPNQRFSGPVPVPPGFHQVLHLEPSQAADAVYDPIDGFYIPIANFSGVSQPGPEILVFESNLCPCG